MSKYTSNEKLSEKKMSSSTRKKILGILFAGTIAVSTLAGSLYAAFGDRLDGSKELKDFQMPFVIAQGTENEPNYSDFIGRNQEYFEVIKRDIVRYQELLQMPNHADRHKQEIDTLVNKIVDTHSYNIEIFSLATVKNKLADAYHIPSYDIKVGGSSLYKTFVAKDTLRNKVLLNQDSQCLAADVLTRLIELQNKRDNHNFDKTLHANQLSMLFGKTLEIGSKTYHVSKNNQLVEIDINSKNMNKQDKEDDYTR